MLRITVPEFDAWDEEHNVFVSKPSITLRMEHSLLSVSKWEQKFHKSFFVDAERTLEELLYYFDCMILDEHDDDVIFRLSEDNVKHIVEYINDKATASWISSEVESINRAETITTELIYYWMVAAQIPFSAETWHLNRLLMLIRIYGEKNKKQEPVDRQKQLERQQSLNEKRLREMGYYDKN